MSSIKDIKTAFFSMEVGIDDSIPTYAGGLGILAGDALKSCADMKLPVIGISLLYRKGYFLQKIRDGRQLEEDQLLDTTGKLEKLENKAEVMISGQKVTVSCWKYIIKGVSGGEVQVLFLDTDNDNNPEYFRRICHRLYAGGHRERIAQEMILGIGGVKMLKDLGCKPEKFHMNEGHTSFLALELLKNIDAKDKLLIVRNKCVFTTHTPVPAGHDEFSEDLIREMAPDYIPEHIGIFEHGRLNMTNLGLKFSNYINGVARKHRKVTREMFPGHEIQSITNGVHSRTWISRPLMKILEMNIPEWHEDPFSLRAAMNIKDEEIWGAHQESKKILLDKIKEKTGIGLDLETFTIGFARRFVEYKRPYLIFFDIERLKRIAQEKGSIQIIFSGKAHPGDEAGKNLIQGIIDSGKFLEQTKIKVVFLEDYCMETARLMVSGCDMWLNNPRRPMEASGTSGMKAALNGVPHFSTLDGWWLEGHIEDVTGWSIGLHPYDPDFDKDFTPDDEAPDLYFKLDTKILPLFYNDRKSWIKIMKSCIAINGSFFNTHRMMQQYLTEAYLK